MKIFYRLGINNDKAHLYQYKRRTYITMNHKINNITITLTFIPLLPFDKAEL